MSVLKILLGSCLALQLFACSDERGGENPSSNAGAPEGGSDGSASDGGRAGIGGGVSQAGSGTAAAGAPLEGGAPGSAGAPSSAGDSGVVSQAGAGGADDAAAAGAGGVAIGGDTSGGAAGDRGAGGSSDGGPDDWATGGAFSDSDWEWAKLDGEPFYGAGKIASVAPLPNGALYAVGEFNGNVTFGDTVLTTGWAAQGFIAKLDATGKAVWAKQLGSSTQLQATAVTALADGAALVAGSFYDDAQIAGTTLSSAGYVQAFVAKFDAAGKLVFAKAYGEGSARPTSISATANGSFFVAGDFFGAVTFGDTLLPGTLSADGYNYQNSFLMRCSADGALTWAIDATHTNASSAGVTALGDGSGAYLVGRFWDKGTWGNTKLTSAGNDDIFVAKYDGNGAPLWAAREGVDNPDYGQAYPRRHDYGVGVSLLPDGGICAAGVIDSFGPFVARFDPAGKRLWSIIDDTPFLADGVPRTVAARPDGTIYVGGEFTGTVTVGGVQLTSYDWSYPDAYVLKLSIDGKPLSTTKIPAYADDPLVAMAASSDGLYVTGAFNNTTSLGTRKVTGVFWDSYVGKMDVDDEGVWLGAGFFVNYTGLNNVSVVALPDGSSYTIGNIWGIVDFDEQRLESRNLAQIYVAKRDANGKLLSVSSVGSASGASVSAVARGADGSIYLLGSFAESMQFGDTKLEADSGGAVFVAKYDSSGAPAWAVRTTGYGQIQAHAISALSDGSVLVTGSIEGIIGFGAYAPTPRGGEDLFIAKVEANGHVAWLVREGAYNTRLKGLSVAALPDGTSYVAGEFQSFDGAQLSLGGTTFDQNAAFLIKCKASGQAVAGRQLVGATLGARALSVLGDGSAVLHGTFVAGTDFGGTTLEPAFSYPDLFVARYQGTALKWAVPMQVQAQQASAIVTMPDGTIGIAGSIDVDNLAEPRFGGRRFVPTSSGAELFVAQLDTSGQVLGLATTGTPNGDAATSLSPLPDGSILVSGPLSPDMPFGETTLVSNFPYGAFVAKLAPLAR